MQLCTCAVRVPYVIKWSNSSDAGRLLNDSRTPTERFQYLLDGRTTIDADLQPMLDLLEENVTMTYPVDTNVLLDKHMSHRF